MAEFQIKRVTLPSGKVVEIVYLQPADGEPVQIGEPTVIEEPAATIRVRRIELCPSCGGDRVHPTDWSEVQDMRWELHVRCPDCRWRATDVFEQPEVERFDDFLAAGTDHLIAELDRVTRENMADQLERFLRALEHDAIEPMDF
jgi:hypothetical protein